MSAQLDRTPRYRRMTVADLDAVVAVEESIYPHPWTRGNFADSLQAGYHCWVIECAGDLAGYLVVMVAAGEAHLLNLSVSAPWQRRGIGRSAVGFAVRLARDYGARQLLLEVRPSNQAAIALYRSEGFVEIGRRRGYYPAGDGREDALVMARSLDGTAPEGRP